MLLNFFSSRNFSIVRFAHIVLFVPFKYISTKRRSFLVGEHSIVKMPTLVVFSSIFIHKDIANELDELFAEPNRATVVLLAYHHQAPFHTMSVRSTHNAMMDSTYPFNTDPHAQALDDSGRTTRTTSLFYLAASRALSVTNQTFGMVQIAYEISDSLLAEGNAFAVSTHVVGFGDFKLTVGERQLRGMFSSSASS